ncbi:MAG: hypothetical protein ACTS5F_01165 [Candidatus Hodgkinia cicadicola]
MAIFHHFSPFRRVKASNPSGGPTSESCYLERKLIAGTFQLKRRRFEQIHVGRRWSNNYSGAHRAQSNCSLAREERREPLICAEKRKDGSKRFRYLSLHFGGFVSCSWSEPHFRLWGPIANDMDAFGRNGRPSLPFARAKESKTDGGGGFSSHVSAF